MISRKDLEHLSELSRIDISEKEEEKLLGDLEKILAHFEELKEVETANVKPMSGGTFVENVFREDESVENQFSGGRAVAQFPEKEKGFLRIPPVFE